METQARQKDLFKTGIILLVISFFLAFSAIIYTIWIVRNDHTYRYDATGTVTSSTVFYDAKDIHRSIPYSNVTVGYETPEGRQRKIERKRLTGEYKEGEEIALKCTEDYQDAVLESETHQQPGYLIMIFVLTVFFGLPGLLLVKGHGK